MKRKQLLVVSSDILPYGRDIAESFKTNLLGSIDVSYLEVKTTNFLYLISRKVKCFTRFRRVYANQLLADIIELEPDYIVNFLGPSPFSQSDFIRIRSRLPRVKIFTWFIDVLAYDRAFYGLANSSDFVGTLSQTDLDLLKAYKESSPILQELYLLPCFFNEAQFYNDYSQRHIDVFFVGSWSHHRMQARRRCLKWLAEISLRHNLRTIIVSRSSIKNPIKHIVDIIHGLKFIRYIRPGPLFGHKLAQAYRTSSLVLECPADNQNNANPMRSYEALVCGATILFYGSNSNVSSLPFSNKAELEDQILRFLSSDYSSTSQRHPSAMLCSDSMLSRLKVISSALSLPLS